MSLPGQSPYVVRFYRLLELLRHERDLEPRLLPHDPTAWLAWAHGSRWLLRMLFESRSIAVASGDISLPSVRQTPSVHALIVYLDTIFATLPSEHASSLPEPYPVIAWSPNRVLAEQSIAEEGAPLPAISYRSSPLALSNQRASSVGWDVVTNQLEALSDAQCSTTDALDQLDGGLATLSAAVQGIQDQLSHGLYLPDDYSGIPRRLVFATSRGSMSLNPRPMGFTRSVADAAADREAGGSGRNGDGGNVRNASPSLN
ncbi:uncharacterized protein C8Q71DRAFT_486023 [Rhodofomes roseus]|uniref:Uncharacterized protein n=2 Tax=Rhodofomes roseus TaxID=34475 RepID=A0ABQ8KQ81_9APHY|nr:uncharacterized protein C8Q71DRAFT_486023 [Rhodofomes roseus]KAH9840310.1 hypothetical protein C8Q71DRAFT_486023 [Rhodofomes roseus]